MRTLTYRSVRHVTNRQTCGRTSTSQLYTIRSATSYIIISNLRQCTRHDSHRFIAYYNSRNLQGFASISSLTRILEHSPRTIFEKYLYKLMNNAVFGKIMENVRIHVNMRLVTQWEGRYGAEALIAKPNFHSRSVFSENLVAIKMRKLEVKLNNVCASSTYPRHVCMNFIITTCHRCIARNVKSCALIRSLIYHIECFDVYEIMKRDINRFDTSNYVVDNVYGIPLANKKVPGLMKDENNGAIMIEFVGLKARVYALRIDSKKNMKKVKCVKSNVVAKSITFDDYTRCLFDEIEMTCKQSCIRSKLHEVYTISETKIVLSPNDDKRYVVPDSTDTLPWRHYTINKFV